VLAGRRRADVNKQPRACALAGRPHRSFRWASLLPTLPLFPLLAASSPSFFLRLACVLRDLRDVRARSGCRPADQSHSRYVCDTARPPMAVQWRRSVGYGGCRARETTPMQRGKAINNQVSRFPLFHPVDVPLSPSTAYHHVASMLMSALYTAWMLTVVVVVVAMVVVALRLPSRSEPSLHRLRGRAASGLLRVVVGFT